MAPDQELTRSAGAAAGRPPLSRQLLPAGAATLGLGVVLAIAGVVAAPFFVPGTWIIALGLALLAGAGIAGVFRVRGQS